MTLTNTIITLIRALFFVSLGITLLVLAIIELFTGSFTLFVILLSLHSIYGHTVIAKQAEILRGFTD